jgi:phage shock protein A
MSLYHKLKLLIRASAEEPARKLVELNDIKIFEQEIVDVEKAIKTAKLHLASVKAEAKSLSHSIEELRDKTKLREQQTLEALDKDAELAHDLAALIAEDEILLREQEHQLRQLQKVEVKLTDDLKKAVRALQGHYRQLQIVKASQHGIHGGQLISGHSQSLNSALRDLNGSLESIKNRQLRASYLDEAQDEVDNTLSGKDIEQRLESSGIRSGKHDANAVLERLRVIKTA